MGDAAGPGPEVLPTASQPVEWRLIPGHDGRYVISRSGEVVSLRGPRGRAWRRTIKAVVGNSGYWVVRLHRRGVQTTHLVHRLLAAAFLGPANSLIINHKNGTKTDNRLENIEYVTQAENMRHALGVRGEWHRGPSWTRARDTRLTPELVRAARAARASTPLSERRLARRFGIGRNAMRKILRGETWKHVENVA